eukprot:scaffold5486_cov282-Ochromonas_danica.AAC.6
MTSSRGHKSWDLIHHNPSTTSSSFSYSNTNSRVPTLGDPLSFRLSTTSTAESTIASQRLRLYFNDWVNLFKAYQFYRINLTRKIFQGMINYKEIFRHERLAYLEEKASQRSQNLLSPIDSHQEGGDGVNNNNTNQEEDDLVQSVVTPYIDHFRQSKQVVPPQQQPQVKPLPDHNPSNTRRASQTSVVPTTKLSSAPVAANHSNSSNINNSFSQHYPTPKSLFNELQGQKSRSTTPDQTRRRSSTNHRRLSVTPTSSHVRVNVTTTASNSVTSTTPGMQTSRSKSTTRGSISRNISDSSGSMTLHPPSQNDRRSSLTGSSAMRGRTSQDRVSVSKKVKTEDPIRMVNMEKKVENEKESGFQVATSISTDLSQSSRDSSERTDPVDHHYHYHQQQQYQHPQDQQEQQQLDNVHHSSDDRSVSSTYDKSIINNNSSSGSIPTTVRREGKDNIPMQQEHHRGKNEIPGPSFASSSPSSSSPSPPPPPPPPLITEGLVQQESHREQQVIAMTSSSSDIFAHNIYSTLNEKVNPQVNKTSSGQVDDVSTTTSHHLLSPKLDNNSLSPIRSDIRRASVPRRRTHSPSATMTGGNQLLKILHRLRTPVLIAETRSKPSVQNKIESSSSPSLGGDNSIPRNNASIDKLLPSSTVSPKTAKSSSPSGNKGEEVISLSFDSNRSSSPSKGYVIGTSKLDSPTKAWPISSVVESAKPDRKIRRSFLEDSPSYSRSEPIQHGGGGGSMNDNGTAFDHHQDSIHHLNDSQNDSYFAPLSALDRTPAYVDSKMRKQKLKICLHKWRTQIKRSDDFIESYALASRHYRNRLYRMGWKCWKVYKHEELSVWKRIAVVVQANQPTPLLHYWRRWCRHYRMVRHVWVQDTAEVYHRDRMVRFAWRKMVNYVRDRLYQHRALSQPRHIEDRHQQQQSQEVMKEEQQQALPQVQRQPELRMQSPPPPPPPPPPREREREQREQYEAEVEEDEKVSIQQIEQKEAIAKTRAEQAGYVRLFPGAMEQSQVKLGLRAEAESQSPHKQQQVEEEKEEEKEEVSKQEVEQKEAMARTRAEQAGWVRLFPATGFKKNLSPKRHSPSNKEITVDDRDLEEQTSPPPPPPPSGSGGTERQSTPPPPPPSFYPPQLEEGTELLNSQTERVQTVSNGSDLPSFPPSDNNSPPPPPPSLPPLLPPSMLPLQEFSFKTNPIPSWRRKERRNTPPPPPPPPLDELEELDDTLHVGRRSTKPTDQLELGKHWSDSKGYDSLGEEEDDHVGLEVPPPVVAYDDRYRHGYDSLGSSIPYGIIERSPLAIDLYKDEAHGSQYEEEQRDLYPFKTVDRENMTPPPCYSAEHSAHHDQDYASSDEYNDLYSTIVDDQQGEEEEEDNEEEESVLIDAPPLPPLPRESYPFTTVLTSRGSTPILESGDELSFNVSSCSEESGRDLVTYAKWRISSILWSIYVLRTFLLNCRGRLHQIRRIKRRTLDRWRGVVIRLSIDSEMEAIGDHLHDERRTRSALHWWKLLAKSRAGSDRISQSSRQRGRGRSSYDNHVETAGWWVAGGGKTLSR